jgi:hypothetical protein
VIPAQHEGLFLCRRLASRNEDVIEVTKLDTSFAIQWKGYVTVNPKMQLVGKRTQIDKLYLLMRHRELLKKDLELYVLDQQGGQYAKLKVRNSIPFVPTDFQVTEQAAIIGGYYHNVPVVIHFSFKSGISKILPGMLSEMGELNQIKVHENGAFDVLINAKNFTNQKTIWIKGYDAEGNMLHQIPLQPEPKKNLLFAQSVKTTNETQLVAGVYGNRNSDYSKGIFIGNIDANGNQQLKYYNYGDLENFFKYMKAKREKRVKERIERRRIRGKKLKFNYRFIVHEIVPYNNQFILLGEAFYPRYSNVDRNLGFFYASYPSGTMRDGRVFDGYRYTHAVVMGFDRNGKLLWDNSFEINDVKTFSLEQFVRLETYPDRIALLYLFENQLRSKIIKGNEVLEGKTVEPIKTNDEKDVSKTERWSTSKLDYWYGNYFYAFGIQQIFNSEKGSRRVFFLNKVSHAK